MSRFISEYIRRSGVVAGYTCYRACGLTARALLSYFALHHTGHFMGDYAPRKACKGN